MSRRRWTRESLAVWQTRESGGIPPTGSFWFSSFSRVTEEVSSDSTDPKDPKDMTREEKLEVIKDYVRSERLRRHITLAMLTRSHRPEPSCEGFGEFYNFVEVQLMYTEEGYGDWAGRDGLGDDAILDGAYLYVTRGRRG